MNLLPDHLRYEFYVRYYGSPAKALAIVTDLQALEIARALVERDLDFLDFSRTASQGMAATAVEGTAPKSGSGKCVDPHNSQSSGDSRKDGTSPVTDPQSYSRNDARKGSSGVNLNVKDYTSYGAR